MNDWLKAHPRQATLLLALLCLCTLVPFLGDTLFNTRGEPREAVVALSMWQDGNWILPINNGVDMAYKPPFFHWLVALCSLLTGSVTEFSSRLPSTLALTLMVVATFRFYARRTSGELALLTSLVLLTNFEVHRAGVACRVDMVLTLMMVLALFALYRWTERGLRGVPWLGVLALSGAFLSKGPVGLALPLCVAGVFCLLRGFGFWLTVGKCALVAVLGCLLPLAWYVAAYQQGGERFLALVYEENVLRLLGKMSYASHVNPWPYNVMTLVAGFVPYTLLGLFALAAVRWQRPQGRPAEWWQRLRRHVSTVEPVRLFTFLSFALIFVFYCIPKSKRSVYLLPVYPFVAYYVAVLFLWLRDHRAGLVRGFGHLLGGLCVLLVVAFAVLRLGLVPESIVGHGSHADQNLAMLRALAAGPLGALEWVGAVLPLAAAAWFRKVRHMPQRLVWATVAEVVAVFVTLDAVVLPLVLNTKSDKPQAEIVARHVPEGPVYSFRRDVTPGNPLHPFTVNFYLGDRVVPFEAFRPAEGYLLMGEGDEEVFRARHADYELRLVQDFHHRSCDDRRMLYFYHFRKP